MKYALLIALVGLVGCSSPTSPTPTQPPANTPPVVIAPTPPTSPSAPARNPLLDDPRFNLNFYRCFALDGCDGPTRALFRQSQAPRIYLRTVHDVTGAAMDALTLTQTAAALENVAGSLTGVFGVAGLEQGTGTRDSQPGWITVHWTNDPARKYCGYGSASGNWIELYTNTAGCRCAGGPAIALATVKHELGHVLGFHHTDSKSDLMYPSLQSCDQNPSEREIFHAKIAYGQPNGSFDPH